MYIKSQVNSLVKLKFLVNFFIKTIKKLIKIKEILDINFIMSESFKQSKRL